MGRFDDKVNDFMEDGRPGRFTGRDFSPMDFPFTAFEFDEYDKTTTPVLKLSSPWELEAQKITEETIHTRIYITESYFDGDVQFDTALKSEGFSHAGETGWIINGNGDVEFNNAVVRGTVYASAGTFTGTISAGDGDIGGFTIEAARLYAGDSAGARIQLDDTEKRFAVYDASNNIKVALGYLGNVGTYLGTQYGLYIADGNTVRFEGGGELVGNDYTIASDGAVVIEDTSNTERGRFGSLGTGVVGLKIGDIDPNSGTGDGIYADETGKAVFSGDLTVGTMPRLNDDGLVAHWSLDDGDGIDPSVQEAYWRFDEDVLDATANNNDGTMNNFGPVAEYHFDGDVTDETGNYDGTPTDITYAAGKEGQCAVFNGTSSYVTIPEGSAFGPTTNSAVYSLWFKTSISGVFMRLFSDNDGSNNEYVYLQQAADTNRLRFTINDGTYVRQIEPSTLFNDGEWYHFVGIINRNSDEMKMYINNVQVGATQSLADLVSIDTTGDFTIGASPAGGNNFNGNIDDFRIFDYPLSEAEISALYNRPQEPAHWVDGVSGKALAFSGDGTDYVDPPQTLASVVSDTTDFSFGCWVNFDDLDTGDNQSLICFNDSVNTEVIDIVLSDADNAFRFRLFDGSTNYVPTGGTITVRTTYFVYATYNGSTKLMSLYVDGELVDTLTYSGASFTADGVRIGRRVNSDDFFKGWIDDARVFSRVLTAAEVKMLYNRPGELLTDKWVDTITDNSGGGFTGTNYGASFVPGISGRALAFDGKTSYVRFSPSFPVKNGDSYTISFWGNPYFYQWCPIIGSDSETQYWMFHAGFSSRRLIFRDIDGNYIQFSINYVTNEFHYYTIVVDNNNVTIYIDGVVKSSGGTLPNMTADFQTLGASIFPSILLHGLIDEPRIYNRALTADEIKYLYWNPQGVNKGTVINGSQILTGSVTADKVESDIVQTNLLNATEAVTIGYEGTGTLASPEDGDRRIYIDGDEVTFQEYASGSWTSVNQIRFGGTDSNGNFLPFLTCRGIQNPLNSNISGEFYPGSNYRVFDFESDYNDHNGDGWNSENSVERSSTWSKFGTYSLHQSSTGNGYLNLLGGYTLEGSLGFGSWQRFISAAGDLRIYELSWEDYTTSNYLAIDVSYNISNNQIRLELQETDTSTGSTIQNERVSYSISTADLTTGDHYIGAVLDYESKTMKLVVDNNIVTGSFTAFTITGTPDVNSFQVWVQNDAATGENYVDDLVIALNESTEAEIFVQHYNHNAAWVTDYTVRDICIIPASGGRVRMDNINTKNIPTSSTGLNAGDVYSNGGVLTIVP